MKPTQLAALRRTLNRLGYDLKPLPKVRPNSNPEIEARIKRVQGMTFKTASVKSAMLRTLREVQKHGYSNERYGFTFRDYDSWAAEKAIETHQRAVAEYERSKSHA